MDKARAKLLEAAKWALATLEDNDPEELNSNDAEAIRLLKEAISGAKDL